MSQRSPEQDDPLGGSAGGGQGSAPPPAEAEAAGTVQAARRRRKRRRRLVGLLLVGCLLAAGRWALPGVLPGVVDRLLVYVDMTCTLEVVELELWQGRVTLANVEVRWRSDGAPLLRAAELRGAFDLPALLGGQLRIVHAGGRDLEASLVREADGQLGLVRKILAALPPDVLEDDGEDGLEVRLDRVEVERLHVTWEDRSVSPPVQLQLELPRVEAQHVVPRRDRVSARIEGAGTLGTASIAFVTSYQEAGWGGVQVHVGDGALPAAEAGGYLAAAGIQLAPGTELRGSGQVLLAPVRRGGFRLGLNFPALTLAAGDAQLALREVELAAWRLDPEAGVFGLRRLRAQCARLAPERDAAGAWTLGPLRLAAGGGDGGGGGGWPDLTLRELELGVDALSLPLGDERLDLADLRFDNRGGTSGWTPISLLGSRLEESLPLDVQLTASRVAPLGEALDLDLHLTKIGRTPEFDLDVSFAPLHAAGLERLAPGLGFDAWDGQALSARLSVTLSRSLVDWDPAAGLSGLVLVQDLRLGPQGHQGAPVLLVSELEALVTRLAFDPLNCVVERLELLGIDVGVTLLKDRLRAAGVEVSLAGGGEGGEGPSPTIDLRHVRLDADRVRFEDRRGDPSTRIPLVDLNAEGALRLGGDTTTLRLRADAEGDPERAALKSVNAKLDLVGGGRKIAVSLADLQLVELRGMLRDLGFEAEAGALDLDIELGRGPQDPIVHLTGEAVLRGLRLTDLGSLREFLNVSISLDAALFLLRDHRDEFRVPLDLTFLVGADGRVAGQGVARTIAETIGKALGRALMTSPLRVLTVFERAGKHLVNLIPGVGDDDDLTGEPLVLEFLPASAGLTEAAQARLAEVGERLRKDDTLALVLRHRLGSDDEQRLAGRLAPGPEFLRDLALRLRATAQALELRRRALLPALELALSLGDPRSEQLAREIREHEAFLGRLDGHRVEVEGLLREGAERRAPQRLRRVAQELAAERLQRVVQALSALAPHAAGRIQVHRPRYRADGERGCVELRLEPR